MAKMFLATSIPKFAKKDDVTAVALKLGALALILCSVALPAHTAWAATDYVISGAATTTNGGANRLNTSGDTLTITATGSVTTSGSSEYGVQTTAGGTTITHNAPIRTTGGAAHGINAGYTGYASQGPISGDVTILGTGHISTEGDAASGIYLDVSTGTATITAGNIATKGFLGYGIYSNITTGNATITAGDISTSGVQSKGIQSSVITGNATITAGNIATQDRLAMGIYSTVTTGNSTITAGNISTQDVLAMGIYSTVTTGNSTITAGNISTQSEGIYSQVTTGNSTITAANISTQGSGSIGIVDVVDNGNSTITAGDISTLGDRAWGIYSQVTTGNSTITAGNISTVGVEADGISAWMEPSGTSYLSIVNNHTISVTGANAMGIKAVTSTNHASITNTGTISSAQSSGIFNSGDGLSITNSGTIIGRSGSVVFLGYDNTLRLLSGSRIEGSLLAAPNQNNRLVIGPRLNTFLDHSVDGFTFDTNGMPYVDDGAMLVVVDPTVYAAEDDIVGDLTRSVGNAVDARLGSAVGQSVNNVMASTSNEQATGSQWDTWATGLAAYRQQGEEGLYDGFDSTLGGFALGADTVLSSGTRFGSFVGASRAHLNTNAGNEQIDSASTYAGIYAGYTLPDAFVNLGLTGGYADTETSRDVLDNLVEGGIAKVKGNPDGLFIAPQATIGTQIKTTSGILTPSLRVAYTHLNMNSYDEQGYMSVAARTVSTLDLRGQVAFAIKPIATNTGQIDATMRLGADATFTNSDDISATVLSQPLTFSTTQDTALRGFAGLDLAQAMNNGAKLNLSVEAGYGTNSAVTLQGTAGLVWAF